MLASGLGTQVGPKAEEEEVLASFLLGIFAGHGLSWPWATCSAGI